MKVEQKYIMTADEFIKKLWKAQKAKTLYVYGCFGAPLSDHIEIKNAKGEVIRIADNKTRYMNNHAVNRAPARQKMIETCSNDTFGYDCIGLIKGILWGADEKKDKLYGGAVYKSNGVPDYNANGFFTNGYVYGISRDFAKIKPGAVVHMDGHVGVYVGNGQVIESTSKWSNNVLVSNLGNVGNKRSQFRVWTNYGYLPCINYDGVADKITEEEKEEEPTGKTYTVKKGDTLTKVQKETGRSIDEIIELNKRKYPSLSRNFIVTGWILEV